MKTGVSWKNGFVIGDATLKLSLKMPFFLN